MFDVWKKVAGKAKASLITALTLSIAMTQPAVVQAATKSKSPVKVKAATVTPLSTRDLRMVSFADLTMQTLRQNAPIGAQPGTWKGSGACWRCDAGPALALAAVAARTGDSARRTEAEAILDLELRTHQQTNGSFGTTTTGSDIDTMFFANVLGVSAMLLKPSMDPAKYSQWSTAVAKAADFLIAHGNLAWYTNGNIVIGNALTMALAYRLTGITKYSNAYETALSFAVNPSQTRWPGRGLIYTTRGSRADGLDSKGYFTEEGYGIGWDPEYTMVQMDHLSVLYLVTNDSRVHGYLNALINQMDSRISKVTYFLDTSGGTRRPQMGRLFPFDTGAWSVMANLGGRTDLQQYIDGQATMYMGAYSSGEGDRLRAAFGWTVASVLMGQPENAQLR
ncbi:hypothetical protein [Actinoplanes sp. N902-109]|uniref:hypothetical protein n=1 Tax=Actinoplanes sp. (strain N902-109) TaxID=649831 RepID=UPI0003295C14|nr:hypothetical protein [Actinoplanes sp. N902-109]AGL20848.1 hypothetical protein L083_7338 [Actinoplanes sp. N902-109]